MTVPQPASEVPGPRLPRPLQSWLGVVRPVESRLALRKRYGTVFRSNDVIAGQLFHIADRELIEQMFKWKPAQYNVGEPRQVMEPVTGPSSILLLDAERHMRMRKLMLPPFHGEAIAHYAELIEQITNREIDSWRPGDTIRTRTVAQTITMEVIIRAVFGITDSRAHRRAQAPVAAAVVDQPAPRHRGRCEGTSARAAPGAASSAIATASTRCSTRRSSGAAHDPDRGTRRRHPDPAAVRPRRGRQAAHRSGAARRADHAPAGGARNDRYVDRLGVRAPAAHPAPRSSA